MHETGKNLLKLMFRDGERICISPNKYGYHSVPLENAMDGKITLVLEKSGSEHQYVDSSELTLVALNPIKGFRKDSECTAYRNFLVEMDTGDLKEQLKYIKRLEMPYSAVIFSGNKSLHFLISLSNDLPSEKIYRVFSEWVLAIATLADPNTVNPSRSIRIPGAEREPGKLQRLVEMKGPVSLEALTAWIQRYPQCRPKERVKRQRIEGEDPSLGNLKPWVRDRLANGLKGNKGRNKQWFAIACEFALAGYSEDGTIEILSSFFEEDRDFKEKEWKASIESGFKYIYNGK